MKYPKSNTVSPWALVLRGGAVPGQRQRTRLVYVTDWATPGDGRTEHMGYIVCGDGSFAKTIRPIACKSIRCAWRDRPSRADIKRFKDSIPVKG